MNLGAYSYHFQHLIFMSGKNLNQGRNNYGLGK